jgi:hypothetical protein
MGYVEKFLGRPIYGKRKLPILWNKYSVLGWFFFIGFIRKLK